MRNFLRLTIAALVVVSLASTVAIAAETPAVSTMAGILAKLNHFASDAEKATLKGIVDDKTSTVYEKTVAQAMWGIMHSATAADKTKLEALVKDAAAPASVKTLATVILGLTHTASAAEKDTVKKLVNP